MNSLTNNQKSIKKHIKKEKIKNKFARSIEDNNNYVTFYKDEKKCPEKEESYHQYRKFDKIYINKKNNFIKNKPNEMEIENKYKKINDNFDDPKNDSDSLILQIIGTKSIKEIMDKKNNNKKEDNNSSSPTRTKTPEKNIKDIKKKAKSRKIKENQNINIEERNYEQELNKYNNNNKSTATFNEDDNKSKEFTFHNDENIKNGYNNNDNDKLYIDNKIYNKNGGKVDLFDNSKEKKKEIKNNDIDKKNIKKNHLSIDVDSRRKILKLLKLSKMNLNKKKKEFLYISKSQDLMKSSFKIKSKKEEDDNDNSGKNYNNYGKKYNNFGNKGRLDKRLLKEIIDDKGNQKLFEKKLNKSNDYKKNSIKLKNHSFEAPITYKKKIIKNQKAEFKEKRVKTEDKLKSSINSNDKNNYYLNYDGIKKEKNIINSSLGINNIIFKNSLTPINKRLIYADKNNNIINNYYNNNFYDTPIKNNIQIGMNQKSRSLNNSIKNLINKSKKNKNYNYSNKKDKCINISLNMSSNNLNDSFFTINNINNSFFPKYEIKPFLNYEYKYDYKISKMNLNKNKFQNIFFFINFEELMIIGEKLFEIIKMLQNNKKMANQCFEFWNYFFNSSLPEDIKNLILNSELRDAIYSINYTLMSILICYDYSFNKFLVEKCFYLLKENLELIINNYIILCKYIIKKVDKNNQDNKWIFKLNNMLSKNDINNINNCIIHNKSFKEKFIYNTNIIIKNLKIILEHFKSNSNQSLLILFKNISQKNYEEINYYYRTFLLREENINGSFLASLYLKDNPNFQTISKPYITKKNNKKYTLILDLEETLLSIRLKSYNNGEAIIKMRPGLFEFLDEIKKFFEIIVFTASSQDYAESLIDSIEEKKKYFDYKFFRQHNIIIENDFVKDLSRIGRDLDKMIIVDNMPQNYRLHKENGINIKGFWGEDLCDRLLFNLKKILIKIAKEGGDLRNGLTKYHEDIAEKVTSNIYKFNYQ